MDCNALSEEDELAVDVYSICTANGFQNSFSERDIINLLDDQMERGYTESKLRELNKTLAQVLQNSKDFRNCGRDEWKAIPADALSKMDIDYLIDEDQLAIEVYSICTAHGFQNSFPERDIIKLLDDQMERGYTESKLRGLNKTLAQVLQNSEHFRNCGRGEWKAIPADGMDHIHESLAGRPQ